MMRSCLRYLLLSLSVLFLAGIGPLSAQSLVINEFMASNTVTMADPDYKEFGDWIELYNAGNSAVNLKGYSVTDLLTQPKKYLFTADIILAPHAYLILWADDKTTGTHTNFKLSASGESIGLFDPAGAVVDTLSFGAQSNDVSRGRFPDGAAAWFAMAPATPGSANLESGIADRLPRPVISHSSGFYPSAITVTVTPPPGATVRYTLDGHTPTISSPLYSLPILIDSTRVLRLKAFKSGSLPSTLLTVTYLINERTDLPVLSLVTDPENFFSDTSGIYVAGTNGIIENCSTVPRNWNQDWERPADLEFFETDKHLAFTATAGVKIYGGCSRLYPEKSLAFYFRSVYGYDKLRYRLFSDRPITEYNNFTLRSSGQDWWRTMFRDGMAQTLIEQEMNVDHQDYRPAILFINGQYWGIHNVGEKLNEHYVESHYNIIGDSIDLVEISKGIEANMGDMTAYNTMMDFIGANSLAVESNYQTVASMIDMENYLDYQIAQIFSANGDWPGSNMKLWRERRPGARWRWMVYDLDFTFGGNAQGQFNTNTLAQATATNGPSWPNPPWATLMLRKLLEHPGFRNEFIQRYAVRLNTTYNTARVTAIIDSLAKGIESEVPRHKTRWPQSFSLDKNDWKLNVQIMKDFAALRPDTSAKHFLSKFGIVGMNTLVIGRNDPSWGRVYTHSVEVVQNKVSHRFFRGIPLRIRAKAMPGYRFVQWRGALSSAAAETTLLVSANDSLIAVFAPAALSVTAPVINEINYRSHPQFDTEDWVELYNPTADPVDLTGWRFGQDTASAFRFPAGTILGGRGYRVLCRDTAKFRVLRPEVKNIIGNIGFGLSSSGDHLFLWNAAGAAADEVSYAPLAPWVTSPNGNGPTLSLADPQLDNALPASWKASKLYGTPGMLNDVYTSVEQTGGKAPASFALFNNFPNPFNPVTTISYRIPHDATVTLTVHSVLGTEVARLVNERQEAGEYAVQWNAASVSSGIYFYTLRAGAQSVTRRMLLLK